MPSNGNITITNIDKTETFALNGVVRTLADAVSKFQGGAAFNGVVKVNGREVTDMDYALRDNDVVILVNRAVAGGGVKGAL